MRQSSTGSAESFSSSLNRVGRDGFLRLAFERVNGRTILTEQRFTLPLQALVPMELGDDGSSTLMLLNPTGGLVGGDRLRTEAILGPGAHVCLTTPAATKVYRSTTAAAVQETRLVVGAGAVLEYIPDHVIPFPDSALCQSVEVEMGEGSVVLLLDALAVGRLARGESWRFRELESAITVRSARGLLLRERFVLSPGQTSWNSVGGAEGKGYMATLACLVETSAPCEELLEECAKISDPVVLVGGSLLARGGVIFRVLAPSAPALQETIRYLWSAARHRLLGKGPLEWRKG